MSVPEPAEDPRKTSLAQPLMRQVVSVMAALVLVPHLGRRRGPSII